MASSAQARALADSCAAASSWLATQASQLAATVDGAGRGVPAGWQGPAASAYAARLGEIVATVSGAVAAYAATSAAVGAVGDTAAQLASRIAQAERRAQDAAAAAVTAPPERAPAAAAERDRAAANLARLAPELDELDQRAAAAVRSLPATAMSAGATGSVAFAAAAAPFSPLAAARFRELATARPGDLAGLDPLSAGLALGMLDPAEREAVAGALDTPTAARLSGTVNLVTQGAERSGLPPGDVAAALAALPQPALALVGTAASFAGVREQPGNHNPFASIAGHADGQAWCATFTVATSALSLTALPPRYGPDAAVNDAYTVYQRNGWQQAGAWVDAPPNSPAALARGGDFVYFRWSGDGDPTSHVGLVAVPLPNGRLLTVEGNVGGTGGSDAGGPEGVHIMARDTSQVVGYGRPAFDAAPADWSVPASP